MVTQQPQPEQIRAHIERYRLTTVDVVHRLFFPDKSRDAAKKCLNRLVDGGRLASFPIGKRTMYRLSEANEIGSQTLWERFAMLAFCQMQETRRERLTPAEFSERFPQFAEADGISPAHQAYFVELGTPPRLGRALVDSDATAERLLRKCREALRVASNTPGLLEILDAGLFVFAVLISESSKARDIDAALKKEEARPCFEVHAIPELRELIGHQNQWTT